MREHHPDRRLPVFATLVVVALLLMTFDVRMHGGGVAGLVRDGTGAVFTPLQRLGSAIVDPVAETVDGLLRIGALRAENEALRARLASAQAELTAVEEMRARLDTLERILVLEPPARNLTTTAANVVARSDAFDLSFRIDKGSNEGILAGHPVLDEYGHVVGKVVSVSPTSAVVVPITGDVDAITVLTGGRTGSLAARVGTGDLELEIIDRPIPLRAGDQVVTSQLSTAFPSGLLIGEVAEDAAPVGGVLLATVHPLADLQKLRAVVVVTWPADQSSPAGVAPSDPLVPLPTTPPSSSGDGG
jgi:rod shape-determining protein MreC